MGNGVFFDLLILGGFILLLSFWFICTTSDCRLEAGGFLLRKRALCSGDLCIEFFFCLIVASHVIFILFSLYTFFILFFYFYLIFFSHIPYIHIYVHSHVFIIHFYCLFSTTLTHNQSTFELCKNPHFHIILSVYIYIYSLYILFHI